MTLMVMVLFLSIQSLNYLKWRKGVPEWHLDPEEKLRLLKILSRYLKRRQVFSRLHQPAHPLGTALYSFLCGPLSKPLLRDCNRP